MSHLTYKLAVSLAAVSFSTSGFAKTGPSNARRLNSAEIHQTVSNKSIRYAPRQWADSAIREDFLEDGTWRGVLYGRGPIPFSGRWSIEDDQLCVTADPGSYAQRWHAAQHCRKIWTDLSGTQLQIDYLIDYPAVPHPHGLQVILVGDLDAPL